MMAIKEMDCWSVIDSPGHSANLIAVLVWTSRRKIKKEEEGSLMSRCWLLSGHVWFAGCVPVHKMARFS